MPQHKLSDDVERLPSNPNSIEDCKPGLIEETEAVNILGHQSAGRIGVFMRVALACVLVAAFAAVPAYARVKKVQISAKESPTFGGYSWPGVGQYEKIVGKAFGELDPKDPKNAVIVDLQLAPKNANGKVDYSFDFYILKPIDLAKGNHKMLYEPPNRGRKTHAALNRGAGGNDPGSVTDPKVLANTFLPPRG